MQQIKFSELLLFTGPIFFQWFALFGHILHQLLHKQNYTKIQVPLQIFERPQRTIYNIYIYINYNEMKIGITDFHVFASDW